MTTELKTEVETLHGNFKKVLFEIPVDIVAHHFEEHFKDVQRQAELKGFRKGKAPLNLIKQYYGSGAGEYVAKSLIQKHLFKTLKDLSLDPVGNPKVDAPTPLEGTPYKFSAEFEHLPPVVLNEYLNFKAPIGAIAVADEEVSQTIERLRNQIAKSIPAPSDAAAEAGMIATLDYDASEAGKEVPEASEKDGAVEIGAKQVHEDFEKHLIGMSIGNEKSFSVKFPAAAKQEESTPVSGRTIDFHVTLKGLSHKSLPDVNDDFAKQIGPFSNLEELKVRVREDLHSNKSNQEKREKQEKFLAWLIEQNPVDAPETMLASQMEQLAMDAGLELSRLGLNEQAIETRLKEWAPNMQDRAIRQVKASLLLGAIADKEQIQANDEDLRKELVKLAGQTGKNPKDIWEDMQKRNLSGGFIRQITELKALDWVLVKAVKA